MKKIMDKSTVVAIVIAAAAHAAPAGQLPAQVDERFKSDVLLVVAHPDDETAVGSYLARLAFDERKKIAVVYCTRGTGGGNSAGREQASALGLIRDIEGRRALAKFGIDLVWFAGGTDTPGQDVFRSLQNWDHGAVLEEVVRFIRLTRPEVILTWLPAFVAGENHGDHQAAGVITTEAFTLSADPSAFPAQVTPAREPADINNSTEGLAVWQAKKLYYVSDAGHPIDLEGPAFDLTAVSPSQKAPYYMLAAELHLPHRTQGDVSENARDAVRTNDFGKFVDWLRPFRLLFGKSVVTSDPTGEVFEGIIAGEPAEREPTREWNPAPANLLQLGGPFEYYRTFWRRHDIEHIGRAIEPELQIGPGSYVNVPLLLSNESADSLAVELASTQPDDWQPVSGMGRYVVAPRSTLPVQTFFFASDSPSDTPGEILWTAKTTAGISATVRLKVTVSEWTLPQ